MAVSFMLSWYNEVWLAQLETCRAGIQAMSDAGVDKLHARSCVITSYVNTKDFIPPVDEEDIELGGDGDVNGDNGEESSSEEPEF
jgi:hypothetical protein